MKAVLSLALLIGSLCPAQAADPGILSPTVEIEETVYSYTNANNGAGPLWCHGSTCLGRIGDRLFATGLETVAAASPLNNCRWVLWERTEAGWQLRRADAGRTREPSPLAVFGDGRVWVSTNPTLAPDRAEPNGGPARPELVQFEAGVTAGSGRTVVPVWDAGPKFTEHSYRSFAADGGAGELIVFQNIGYTHAEWAFLDRDGHWSAQGKLKWPWGGEYAEPQPIRVCYPNVQLRGRAVHVFGVSDIQEPNLKWREFKHRLTGQHWDYDFRRLFYTWTPDITSQPFRPWTEIASREATCGQTANCDLWLSANGDVHLLWTERAIDERLRKEFFPDARQSHSLRHAVLRDGKVIRQHTLFESTEDRPGVIASAGRFQPTPDQRLFVCQYAGGTGPDGRALSENRVLELRSDGTVSESVRLPLRRPFTAFFTATPRAGSPPSDTVEMLGQQAGGANEISYARVRLR